MQRLITNRVSIVALLLTMMSLVMPVSAADWKAPTGERGTIKVVHAKITAIDYETREFSLQTPQGDINTLTAGEEVKRLADFAVGDEIVATYLTALAAELREPTEEEMANPFVVVKDAAKTEAGEAPGAAMGRVVRAVCTIEGMNRVVRTVMIADSRGKYHIIDDVKLERFSELSLGQTVIMTYSEAVALTLEKGKD
ncbi:MAG: hypothetical protein HOC23_02350 [Halieaceae bacterium]|jgi:hypothetical protein|nr:hypothetical protein [Halieaceae bacterium]